MESRKGKYRLRRAKATTNNITTAIVNHLRSEGHGATRVNTQGQWDEARQCWRKSGSTLGASDIIGCLWPTGRFWGIEVKKGKDRIRPDQDGWLADMAAAGALVSVVHTYTEFVTIYLDHQKAGIICRRS